MARRIDHYLQTNNLFSPFQSAYRANFSTETALVRLYNDLLVAKSEGDLSCVILLDLSAAFDTVDHSILLERLQLRFGFSGNVVKWFSDYLTNRSQCVRIDSVLPQYSSLKTGVPQGSVLGPRLYSLYIAPLSDIISSYGIRHQIYADDTSLYVSLSNSSDTDRLNSLQICLEHISEWFASNRLKLNPEKTECLLCGPTSVTSRQLSINVCGQTIQSSAQVKSLGIIFDYDLSLSQHVSQLCRSSFYILKHIRGIRQYANEPTVRLIVQSFIFSKLDYCNSLLAGSKLIDIIKLQRLQNCCARIIKKLRRYDPVSAAIADLHWLPVRKRIQFKLCCLAFKAIHKISPQYLSDLIRPAPSQYPSTRLRSQTAIVLFQPRLHRVCLKGAFAYSAPLAWNSLPPHCRQERDYQKFKRSIKTHFFSND